MSNRKKLALPICLSSRLALQGIFTTTIPAASTASYGSVAKPLRTPSPKHGSIPRSLPCSRNGNETESGALRRYTVRQTRNDLHQTGLQKATFNDLKFGKARSEVATHELFRKYMLLGSILLKNLAAAHEESPDDVRLLFSECHQVAQLFLLDQSPEQFKVKWQALTPLDKARILPSLLTGTLVDSAEQCLFVLANIDNMPRRFYYTMSCLLHIHVAYGSLVRKSPAVCKSFHEQISLCRLSMNWSGVDVPVRFLDLLLQYSSPVQCEKILEAYKREFPFSSPQSLIPFLNHYVRIGKFDRALEMFKELPTNLLENPSERLADARDEALRRDTVAKTSNGSSFALLPQLLALGCTPDVSLHNAVLQGAMHNNLPDVAWDLYQYLGREGLEVNAQSYFVLLKDAFARGNVQGVDEIMTAIHQRKDLLKSPQLITCSMNIARAVSFYERQVSSTEAMSHVMAIYDRVYSRRPLHALRIVENTDQSIGQLELPAPEPAVLAFTVWSYILVQRACVAVDALWDRITILVRSNRDIFHAMQHDYIYNAFIYFYARQAATLPRTMTVLQHMLEEKICPPSSLTWNFVICAHLRHGLIREAEDLIKKMQDHGMSFENIDGKQISRHHAWPRLQRSIKQVPHELDMPRGIESVLTASSGEF